MGAGLPNITGEFITKYSSTTAGAFKAAQVPDTHGYTSFSGNEHQEITFDASRSSTVYGNSSAVTPLSESTLWCVKY